MFFSRKNSETTRSEKEVNQLMDQWWYYSAEIKPGVSTKGIYPESMPLLPRLALSNMDIRGQKCLDVCTMEGLIPILMKRQGAKEVVAVDSARPSGYPKNATDSAEHNYSKLQLLQGVYGAEYDYYLIPEKKPVVEELVDKKRYDFDVINFSGLLYHVYSPLHWLGSVRPLLRTGGLMVISTNVTLDNSYTMTFNQAGALQSNLTTYWYLSIPFFDYMLRYSKLAPIDCFYMQSSREDKYAYLSVICRAEDKVIPSEGDKWMEPAASHSWEAQWYSNYSVPSKSRRAPVSWKKQMPTDCYREDTKTLDLYKFIQKYPAIPFDGGGEHTAWLKLNALN